MGNSACLLASGVTGISDAELNRLREQDELCLSLLQQQLPQGEVGKFAGLDGYKVLGSSAVPKAAAKPEAQELGLLCLQDNATKLADKFGDVRTALQNEIKYLSAKEPSAEKRYKNSRLQVLCRVYDAFLRQEERERRRVEASKQVDKKKEEKTKSALPPLAKVGLGFGMEVLLRLVEAVGGRDPGVVSSTIDIAASVMTELKPMSLATIEPGLSRSVDSFSHFFERIIAGAIPGLDKTTEFKAVTVMLGIALAKGDYTAALSLVQKFLTVPSCAEWTAALPALSPMLGNLTGIATSKGLWWNWNSERQGPDIVVSNEGLTITRTNSSGWGNQKSEQSVSDGIYYVEFKIDRNSSSCLCIGVVASSVTDYSNKCSYANCICYQADGDTYKNGSSCGNIGSYTAGDRIGMLIDMEEHKLTYYKNGTKMNRDAFDQVPNEVNLIICFGGSDQFVSINPEAEPPAEISGMVSVSKKKEEEEAPKAEIVFAVNPCEIVEDTAFSVFTKQEGTAEPSTAATFLLAALVKLSESSFSSFNLDSTEPKYPKNVKIQRSNGLVVDVKPKTFSLLIEILEKLRGVIDAKNWTEVSFKQVAWASLSAMRLLRNHIFTAIMTSMSEEESGLSVEVKERIRAILRFFSTMKLENFGIEATAEAVEARNVLDKQALLVTLHSLELFFPTLNSQLEYVMTTLNSQEADEAEKKVANDLLKKLSQPAMLFRAFACVSDEERQRVNAFTDMVINLALEASKKILAGEEADSDAIQSLFVTQSVVFGHVAKTESDAKYLALARAYMDKVFAGAHELIEIVKSQSGDGTLSDELEGKVKKTILDRLVITLLRTLSVLQFDSDFSAYLISEMTKLAGIMSSFRGGKTELTTGTAISSQIYESEHPYPNSADQTHSVVVPGALFYTLTFDNECKTESGYDYLQLWNNSSKSTELFKWHGNRDQFPTSPLTVNQPELFFTFHSDGGTNYWGWKIVIEATVEVTISKEGWVDELQNSVSALLVALCKNLTAVDVAKQPANQALDHLLLRSGISDAGVFLVSHSKPLISQTLAELIATTQTEESLPTKSSAVGLLKLGVMKSLIQRKVDLKPSLSAYLSKLGSVDSVAYKFCDIPIIDELITGSERTIAAFEGLKEQARMTGPLANLGGAELDQAERALFGVFLAFFELANSFAALVDEPQEMGDMFKFILKQAGQIRPWAQLQRQQIIEASNKELTYADLGNEVVEKCVLLLHSDFKHTLHDIGIDKVLQSLMATIKRTQTSELEEKGGLKAGSRWKAVKKSVATLSRMKTLQGLQVLRRAERAEAGQEEDKKQFLNVYKLVMEVLGSNVSSAALAEEVAKRRNRASARCIGLNLMSMAFKAAPEASKGELQGLISTAFSDCFTVEGAKKHYSVGTEGTDTYLSSCLQRSFFQLYQLLLNRLRVSAIRNLDCTSEAVTQNMMSTFDALSFPFSENDATHLLDLNIREPAQFLLSWAKGQNFFEKLNMKFDRSKVIVDLKVMAESDYHPEAGSEAFSLNPKNRLAGEVAEEIEGQQKLVLQVIRGNVNTELNPICAIIVANSSDVMEGMEKIEGNINELGAPERSIFFARGEPKDGAFFLKKVFVCGWDPIDLCGELESFSHFLVTDVPAEEAKKRAARKDLLRRSAWLLFKLLMFSSAGKFNETAATVKQSRRAKLQQLFAELLMAELKCLTQKAGAEESLELRKLVSGRNWRSAEIPLSELHVSPMGDWMGKIREDAEEYLIHSAEKPGVDEISLTDVINDYVGSNDPLMKGHIPASEYGDLPAEYRNSAGEVDFFCFLKHLIAHVDSMVGPFWQKYAKTSKLLQSIPSDFTDAQKNLGGSTVSSILNAFISTMNPNDDDSFLAYLKIFNETETPGIVSKENAPKTAPATFFNEDGQLDFFTAYKYVTSHPDQFPQYFRELKMFTRAYELPSSCGAFYKASLSPTQAEYQASLLLLLYQCSGSKGMLAVLGAQQTVLELLKHMFFGSLKASTIAFRIVKELIASEHSPESFEGLWASFPKAKMRAEYGEETVSQLVLLLLAFIGIKSSIHIKSWKYSFLSLEKIEALAFEATGFLQSLCKNQRWREHIVSTCCQLVAKGITTVPTEQGSETTIGAIGFLKSLDGRRDMFMHEWSHVELKGAGVSQGILIKRKRDAGKLKLYCEGDDALHTENVETFVSTVPESKLSLYSQLPEELVNELFNSLAQLVIVLDDPVHNKAATTSEMRVNNAAVRRLVQSSAMEILASVCDTKHELQLAGVGDFVVKLIEYMNVEDQPYFPAALYYQLRRILYARHKSNVSTQVRSTPAPIVISDEEEAKIIASYNEEKQILVATFKSVGLSFVDIKDAMEHEHTEMDAVLKYIEQRNASLEAKKELSPADNLLLYKLAKNDKNPAVFKDPTGNAVCAESQKGHMIITAAEQSVGRKTYLKLFEDNIFANLEKTPEELTVLVAIGGPEAKEGLEFGFRVGETEVAFSAPFDTKLFRLFFRFDGHVAINDESAGVASEQETGFSFEDIASTRFGVFLSSSGTVELKGMAVFTGHFTGTPNYWEEEIKEPPAAPGKFVAFKSARKNATASALVSALGVEYGKAVELSQRFPELRGAIKAVFSESVPLSPLTTDFGHYVVDVAVGNTAEELPAGYEKAPIYVNRTETSDYTGYAGKFIGLKVSAERSAVFVKGIEVAEENLSILREEKGQGAGLVSVLVIRVTDSQAVDIPAGYVVVGDGTKGFNLTADSGQIHFLAYRTSFNFRQQPFTDFSQMPTKNSDGGLVDSYDQTGPASTLEFDSKRISEETTAMNAQSTVQLQTRLAKLEKAFKKETCFKLVLKLLKRWADCLQDVDKLAILLESSGKKYALLKPTVSAVFSREDLAPLMANALLEDVITQLVQPLFTCTEGGVSQKSLSFESSHPYENSLDRTGEIRIPGAKKLVFTFDPRCKSENNYDYLQFCRDKDYTQELYKHTGSTWPNFEVDGDCVFWKFHSDGSNNDWGYLYTVTAAVSSGGTVASSEDATARALWVLEELVFGREVLPSYLNRFLGKELQNALTLFAHSTSDSGLTLRALFLLKRSLEMPVEVTSDAAAIVELLGMETVTQYKTESSKTEKSSLLKDAVGLVLELKEKYNLSVSADWFVNFYETFCFLKGVDTKDENFQFLLLKQFLELKGRSLDVVRESAHPYAPAFTSKELSARGASAIHLEFTKESEAESDHCILFSKDREGLQPILSGGGSSVNTNVEWATSPTGPNIAISNGGKSVTRTDSSGWGTVISNAVFNSGKIKFTFKIDNDGGSSYLYLGVIGVSPPSLSDCTYKDWSHSMWVYKRTGEFHRRGFSTENSSWGYNTNDEVAMLLDFDEHTVTFFKNGAQMYQLPELVGPVTLSACFGGSGQHLSILSVESAGGDMSKMSDMKTVISGDKFYYHFPANVGYLSHLQTKWNVEKNPLVAFTEENRNMSRNAASSEATTVFSTTSVRGGRQFLEVEIPTLAAGVLMGVGIGLTDQPSLSIAYQSDGVLKKFGESFMVEGFKEGDSIALLLNTVQNELRVFKNGEQLTALPRVVLEEGKDFHWGVNMNGAMALKLKVASPLATSLDLMGRNAAATPVTKPGYKFTAKPIYMGKNKMIAFENLGNLQGEWETYLKKQKHLFSKEVCEQLVNYVDEKCSTTDKEPMALTADDITPTPEELVHYNLLEKLPLDDIKSIFKLIKDLNQQVNSALPLISLDLKEGSQSMTQIQKAFLHLRGFLFLKSKNKTLKEFIARTNTSDQPQIEINRTRAIRQKERGMVDSQGVSSIFGQIYRHMNKCSNRSLRHSERIYKVNFVGEGSIDAGGPYNEVMSNMCEEMMSKYLPLFVPCPNGVNNLGENRDGWVPNPSSDSALHMDLFLFLGKLFGVAIRTQNNLNLSLPPVFWKRLLFDEPTVADLKGFDECIFQTLEILRHMDEQGINADNFTSAFDGETFTTRDSSGRVVELCPGGKDLIVTFENALEYASLLEKQRLFEAADAYAAIRKGMSAVVPMNLIYMFSWKQVETLVCGAADINVDVLKGNTCYEGLSDSSPVVQMFWEVFREMSGKERSLFLRFVWGRSRLPAGKDFKQFKITNKSVSGNADNYLPVSHTCFFTIDMPPYTNKVTMREKLVYAITHCQAIDLDRVVGAEGWEDE